MNSRTRFLLEKYRKLRDQVDSAHTRLDEAGQQAALALRDEGLTLPEIAAAVSRDGCTISPSCASRLIHGARSPLPWSGKGAKAEGHR